MIDTDEKATGEGADEGECSWEYKSKTDEEIRSLARDWLGGCLFITNDPEKTMQVFGVIIAFLGPAMLERMQKADIVAFYERMDKAGPRSINGLPMFLSMQMLNGADVKKLLAVRDRMKEAMDAIEVPSNGEVQDV